MSNPGNIAKYQSDPEVMSLINKARGALHMKSLHNAAPPAQVMGAFSKFGGLPG